MAVDTSRYRTLAAWLFRADSHRLPTNLRVVSAPIAAAMRAILAELERGGTIHAWETELRLPGHARADIETAVMLLEGEGRIIVERETSDTSFPHSFSALELGTPPA